MLKKAGCDIFGAVSFLSGGSARLGTARERYTMAGNVLGEMASSFGLSRMQVALQGKKPSYVIQSIVTSHPESIRRPDLEGLLPLHYAARHNASAEVVQMLIEE